MPVVIKKLTCKLCGETFEERENLPGLRVCEMCDDLGKSGIAERAKIAFARKSDGSSKEKRAPVYIAPGE